MPTSVFSIVSDDIVTSCICEWLKEPYDLIALDVSLTNRDLRDKYLKCLRSVTFGNAISFGFASQPLFKRFTKYISSRSISISRLVFRKWFEFPYFLDENTLACFGNLRHLHLHFGEAIFLSSKAANSYSKAYFLSQLLIAFPHLEHLSLQTKSFMKDYWHQTLQNPIVKHKLTSFEFHTNHLTIEELLRFFYVLSNLCPDIERLHISDGIPVEIMYYIRSLFPKLSDSSFSLNEYSLFHEKDIVQYIRNDIHWKDILPVTVLNSIVSETYFLEQEVSNQLFTPSYTKIIQFDYDDSLEIIEKRENTTGMNNGNYYQGTETYSHDEEDSEEHVDEMRDEDEFSADVEFEQEDSDQDSHTDTTNADYEPPGISSLQHNIHPSVEMFERIISDTHAIAAWKQQIFRRFDCADSILNCARMESVSMKLHVTERPMKQLYSSLTFPPDSCISNLTIDLDLENSTKLKGILIHCNIPSWSHLLSLQITSQTLFTDATIESITMHCPKLECLALHIGRKCIMTDISMNYIATKLYELKKFQLSGAIFITDSGMQYFHRHNLRYLTTLSLQQCDNITPIGFKRILNEMGHQLEECIINCCDAYHHYTSWYCWLTLQQSLLSNSKPRLKSLTLMTYSDPIVPVSEKSTLYVPNIPLMQRSLFPPSLLSTIGKSLQILRVEQFPMNLTMLQNLFSSFSELIELYIKLQELPLGEELLDQMMYGRSIEKQNHESQSLLLFDAIDLDNVSFENLSHLKSFFIEGRIVRIGYDKLLSVFAFDCPYLQDCQIFTYVKETFIPSRQQLAQLKKLYQYAGKKILVQTNLR